MKYIAISGMAVAATVAGIALLGFSPRLCACLTPQQHLSLVAGLGYASAQESLGHDAAEIQSGLNKNLVGKKISVSPPNMFFLDCAQPSPTAISCRVLTEESPLINRGFDLDFVTKPDGSFVSAKVHRTWGWP